MASVVQRTRPATMKQKRLLGIDIGSKRIGLAVWNPVIQMARPLPILHRKTLKEDLAELEKVIANEAIEAIVVGVPYSLGGKLTPSTESSLFWIETLKAKLSLPIMGHDESLSTQEANKILKMNTRPSKRKEKRDSIAAALILEEFVLLPSS